MDEECKALDFPNPGETHERVEIVWRKGQLGRGGGGGGRDRPLGWLAKGVGHGSGPLPRTGLAAGLTVEILPAHDTAEAGVAGVEVRECGPGHPVHVDEAVPVLRAGEEPVDDLCRVPAGADDGIVPERVGGVAPAVVELRVVPGDERAGLVLGQVKVREARHMRHPELGRQ